eukprot:jgi/Mesen1/10260/ME000778S09607
MLIDFVPTVNGVSLADAPAFEKAPGGAPANVAAGIAKLGGHSAFLGKVSPVSLGLLHGVDTRAIRFDKGARTALAFVTLKDDGEREFMFFRNPSADMLLRPDELDTDLIRKAGIVHYGSISLIAEPCKSAHEELMKIAKQSGATLSYDPNLRLPLWPSATAARDGILSIWDHADVIKNYQGSVPGVEVKAIDATGAGDAFVAGFLYQLAQDPSLHENEDELRKALRFANLCGAIATTGRGAIPSLPDHAAVEALV